MAESLDKTMNFLAHTRNQAAVPVLIAALNSKPLEIRVGAICGLVERRSPVGHTQILQLYPKFTELERAALAESLRQSSHHMKMALHDAVLAEHLDLCESACHVILLGPVYDLLPTLVTVAENPHHRHSDQAAATLVRLSRALHQEISGETLERTCDPFFARRQVLPSVERAVGRYGSHQRLEIVDAFLLLVPPTSTTLNKILGDPQHPCHKPVVNSLSTSAVTSVLELVAQLLHDTNVPRCVLDIVAERHDRKFLDYLLHHVGRPISLRVLENVKRLILVAWLQQARDVLLELDGPAQATAVELATAANLDRATLFDLLTFLLERGKAEGRQASCDAMARFQDPAADQRVMDALHDPNSCVQAAAAKQLRRRRVPDAMEKLVSLLDDPASEVRDAARSSLAEFNFIRYQASFEKMDEQTRQTTGRLVHKVDPSAGRRLAEMLSSPSPSMRLRGIDMVLAMEATDVVLDELVRLIDDSELAVRVDAVAVLGGSMHPDALAALRRATHDPSHHVREAAERIIEGFKDRRPPAAVPGAQAEGDIA